MVGGQVSKLTSQCPFSKTLGVVKCAKLPECNAMRDQFQKYFFLKLLAGGDFPTLADHPKTTLSRFLHNPPHFFLPKMALFWGDPGARNNNIKYSQKKHKRSQKITKITKNHKKKILFTNNHKKSQTKNLIHKKSHKITKNKSYSQKITNNHKKSQKITSTFCDFFVIVCDFL